MVQLQAVFDFAAQAGALMLANGAASAEVVQAMLDITRTAGVEDVSIDVTYTQLTLFHHQAGDTPYVQIQTVRGRNFYYGKLTEVSRLVERFCHGELSVAEAQAEIERIQAWRGPYPGWLTRLAAGLAGGSAALIFGGDWVVMLAAFVANLGIDYLAGVLARQRLPTFFVQVVVGVIAVLVAIVVRVVDPAIDPSRVVVSVIIVMLAGMTSTAAVQDAISGWYLTALARIFEAVMNTIGLIVGISFGILVANRLDVNLSVTANVSMGALQLPVMLLGAAFVAIGFGFVAQNPPSILLPTALLSALGYAVDSAASAAQLGPVWSAAAAALVVGVIAVLCAQWFKAPASAFAICAILPLVPGFMLYQGLLGTSSAALDASNPLIAALGTALALAGGVTFGEYLAILIWRQLRWVENRFFAPLFAGPSSTARRQVGSNHAPAGIGTEDRAVPNRPRP